MLHEPVELSMLDLPAGVFLDEVLDWVSRFLILVLGHSLELVMTTLATAQASKITLCPVLFQHFVTICIVRSIIYWLLPDTAPERTASFPPKACHARLIYILRSFVLTSARQIDR